MTFLQKFKLNKAWVTYLTLAVGFFLALLLNVNFVSDRAVTSLTQLQESHTKLQVQSTFNNLQQFIENRAKLLEELAESPMVTSSVMGVEMVAANLHDMLDERKILGTKEDIYVSDFTGELIYPNPAGPNLHSSIVEQIIEHESPFVLMIKNRHNRHYFSLSMPVTYNGHAEGIITFDIVSQSIETLLADLTQNNNYAVSFYQRGKLLFQTASLDNFTQVSEFDVANTPIQVHFYISKARILAEKENYIWQIGSTLTATTLFAFLLLAFLIRSLLINPLEKLAISESRIKQSEERYQLAIEGSHDGIWDWNITSEDLYLSPRLLKMVDHKIDTRIKLTKQDNLFLNLVHPEDRPKLKQGILAHFKQNASFDCELRISVNQDYRFFRLRGIALRNAQGKAIRMSGSLSDITELKEQSLALENALEEAKNANLAKSQFLANMSHEIRTPMNGVLGALQVLKREDLSESLKTMVEVGINSSKSLLHIINDILDLSKIESKNISLESIPTNILELFESIINELSLSAEQKNIKLSFIPAKDLHPYWLIDPVRIRQIIVNLVSNAIKFTKQGEVTLSVEQQQQDLLIQVKDTGIGIPEEQIEKLFNRFEQADITTTRHFGGTGLGLSIAKQLANLMGGDISVNSKVNYGSTFNLLLPLKKAKDNTHAIKLEAESANVSAPNLQGYNLLLAEDNEINQIVFNSLVSPTQATIHIANDGIEAIEIVGKQLPDIIFMDIQMPNMDGMQACEIIKSLHPDLPIVALTANVMSQDIDKYQQIGFDHCLGKPVNVADVFHVLNQFTQSKPL
ncbi:ATP-binding protein [Paraglaciecola aestuariivivens]